MLIEIIGWIGTILLITAYLLISLEKVNGTNKLYQLMNLAGAVAIGIKAFSNSTWQVVTVEIFWGAVSILALARIYKIFGAKT